MRLAPRARRTVLRTGCAYEPRTVRAAHRGTAAAQAGWLSPQVAAAPEEERLCFYFVCPADLAEERLLEVRLPTGLVLGLGIGLGFG